MRQRNLTLVTLARAGQLKSNVPAAAMPRRKLAAPQNSDEKTDDANPNQRASRSRQKMAEKPVENAEPKDNKKPAAKRKLKTDNASNKKAKLDKNDEAEVVSEDESNTADNDDDVPVTKAKADKKTVPKGKAPKKALMNKSTTDFSQIDFSCNKTSASGKEWNFKISSWNVDGIRAWMNKGGLEYINHEKPDILCLQETKCSENKLPAEIKDLPDYHQYWVSSENEGYAGVGIFTKEIPQSVVRGLGEEFDSEGRIITAEYSDFYLICTYVPNAGRGLVTLSKRLEWNKAFQKYVKELDAKKPVVICGDMNVSHLEIDLTNPKTNKKNAGFTQEERDGMTDLLNEGFTDTYRKLYPEETGVYTFWTYMSNCRSKNIGWRLDYGIVSERLMEDVCDNVVRSEVYGSDHCPITLFIAL